MQFLITAIVAVILLVSVVSSCPSGCVCTKTPFHVNCSSIGLESIPTDLPNNTNELELQYNDISMIENNAFSNLPNLQFLYLHHNKITSIKSDMFNNLTNLYWLELQYNDISVIENNAFNNLPDLHILQLQNNDISVIENNAFNNLPNLEQLELQYNDISVIENNAFSNLPNLQFLFLRNNSISYVSKSAFENLPKLTKLHFDMYCRGCGNIPFWRWLKRSQKLTTSVTCNDYDGESLEKLQPNNSTNCFMDPCYSNPCLSNGQCTIDGKGSALCSCHGNWTGSQCELSPCSTVVCNDGECYYNESGIAKCFNKAATKSDDNYTAVYTGVGASIATALVAVIIVTLRYRRQKKQQKRSTGREFVNTTFSDDHANSEVHNTGLKYVSYIPEVEEGHYDTIKTSKALRHA